MEFRYSRWDERLTQNLNFLRHLLSLYHRLLLMTDGRSVRHPRAGRGWGSGSASSIRISRSGLQKHLKGGTPSGR